MARDLTGERLKAAQQAKQEADNGKAAGDRLWAYLMAHESSVRALVRDAEEPPQYSAEDEDYRQAVVSYLVSNDDVLVALFEDWLKKHPRKDEPAETPAPAEPAAA